MAVHTSGNADSSVSRASHASKKPRLQQDEVSSLQDHNMDIKSLINPIPSSSNVASHLPTPPLSRKSIVRKRKRNDPIPIWAMREDSNVREQPPPPVKPTPSPRPQPQNVQRNGQPQVLQWEPSITNEKPYDEISRMVCNFIWENVVDSQPLRRAIAESEGTQVEIEAKWGQIQYRQSGERIFGIHETECIVRRTELEHTKFESTMSIEQHKKMNEFLNKCVFQSKQQRDRPRAQIDYKHIRETDMFYELAPPGFEMLAPTTRMLLQHPQRHKVRVTRDQKNGQILRKIIKHRIANLEISSPQTEWDYRVSINLEIQYPGPVEELVPAIEPGRGLESVERRKDRMSYSHQGACQIDLTQVITSGGKNHELELELDADRLLSEAEQVKANAPNLYEDLVGGMMNNLRVLSREISWRG